MTTADPSAVLDLIEAFRRSKTMFAALVLGVFDCVEKAPANLSSLATELGCDADALERLLDGCVGLGLLEKRDAAYANLPVASVYLCASNPNSLAGYIRYSESALYPLWGNLETAVREGTHRWARTFGLEGPIFSHFFKTDEDMRTFLLGMHGYGQLSSPKVVAAFDLSHFHSLVDLGGATGHLAIAACERYRELRATVFDLPRASDFAREHLERSSVSHRVDFISGDFFHDPLPEADLYALGRILHDWSEAKIRLLLKKIFDRLPTGGALLIAEKLLDDDRSGPVMA